MSGDNEAKAAFSLGLNTLHEFAHGMYGAKDYPNGEKDPGPLENTYLNPIHRELGLAERIFYTAKLVPPHLRTIIPSGRELRFNMSGKEKESVPSLVES